MNQTSRYQRCEVLMDSDNKRYLARMETREYPNHPDDRFYQVQMGDRIDNLAYKFFGDPGYWWVLAEYNNLSFPIPLIPGKILRFPSVGRLLMDVLTA